jgi:hypothetical protein
MKSIPFLFAVLTISFTSWAQKMQPGVKMGVSVPDIEGNTEQSKDYSSRLAPFFGISLTGKISTYFNLQAEMNYSPQGGKRNGMQPIDAAPFGVPEGTKLYANFKNETKLNYLEIPVMLQFLVNDQRKDFSIFYFANAGPYVAFRVKAKTVTSGSSRIYLDQQGSAVLRLEDGSPLPEQSFNSTTDIKNEIKRMNFGIAGGIGTGYNFEGHKFFIEARFTRGLINIQTHPGDGGKNQTGSLIFSAGYIYAFE